MRWPLPDAPDTDPLARVWEATRPAEPSGSVWEPVWVQVSHELDRAGTVIPVTARFSRRYALAALFAAQAAAVVLAVVWTFRQPSPEPSVTPAVPLAVVARGTVDIASGRVVMIRADGAKVRVVEVASSDESNVSGGVEDFYEMFNKFEAGFDTQLALND